MFKRLRNDFQLSIITLMGIIGVGGITPYAFYRLLHGNLMVGIADTVIVLSTLIAVIYAWRTGDTEKPGLYLAGVFSVGATLIAINLGVNGLFWIYPLILFNFFMVSPGKAIAASLLVLAGLVGHALWTPGSVFESHYQMVSFLVTNAMAGVLTFIFAYRTRTQREQLQLLAIQDPLTGARNRRAMNEELKIAVSSKRRHGRSYGVLVMDLDHFKQINDLYGHQAGDQVLIDYVKLIKDCSRQEDRLFRFGGEEFLLLLPDTDAQGLEAAAQNLLKTVHEGLRGPGGPVTVSIGGALLNAEEPWGHWLQRADQCLYQAKKEGRNRAIMHTATTASMA
ncbi:MULTISPECIES: GGDEF domain-containing protein [unclassified Pseudomonas]|uniref:GGDEF domain-containing protein n=1 Tax=unclassified Pseudomonas TaxID=196821 RepID=UPI00244D461E|nr:MULTISPECIES: GGDEF domain-containing protein [unclassified Pseudomonas]MDG9930025.1 GGDEF domain-containing protein [Pseudomonas sp. GD04042]MDH0483255.1 GGDEF domain-containing protein [Pseudomonas sp. GD04015]MDH0606842.1 GGDEF domain-containing protein [Pseudomonas sp. GD03869]